MNDMMKQRRDDQPARERLDWNEIDSHEGLRALVANDNYAVSFQTMGQYRSALMRHLDNLLQKLATGQSGVRSWRERMGKSMNWPLHAPTDVERAMVAEIAELRMAIAHAQRDSGRIQWLEEVGNSPGGLLLHDGSDFTGRCGLGLRRIGRTLRQAVDAARGDRHG